MKTKGVSQLVSQSSFCWSSIFVDVVVDGYNVKFVLDSCLESSHGLDFVP
jgi:hypothetical protein